jgi:hypothetical protein
MEQYNEGKQPENFVDPSIIFISIFLFILIFFILLTAFTKTSKYNESTVMVSVAKTFSENSTSLEKTRLINPKKRYLLISEIELFYLRLIKNIAKNDFEFKQKNKHDRKNIARFSSTLTGMFIEGISAIRDDKDLFIKNLANIMLKSTEGGRLSLEITISSGDSVASSKGVTKKSLLLARRISELRRNLLNYGVDEGHLLVGLSDLKVPEVTFSFFLDAQHVNIKGGVAN